MNKKEIENTLLESAKDFLYYGYSLNSFLNYDSFKGIDKNILVNVWAKAKKQMETF